MRDLKGYGKWRRDEKEEVEIGRKKKYRIFQVEAARIVEMNYKRWW